MAAQPVELRVGGQTYRVRTSATAAELQAMAHELDDRLSTLTTPGRSPAPQSLLLVALGLLHDLQEEKQRRQDVERRARAAMSSLLSRVDDALTTIEALPPGPAPDEPQG